MAQKTEKATPKKLKDARKKGQVAKAQDFPSALTFITSLMLTLFSAQYIYEHVGSYMIHLFRAVRNDRQILSLAPSFLYQALETILHVSLPICVLVASVGVVVNFLVIGPVFSFQAMKFEFKKLNPIEGIKQKFKLKVLVELLKSIAKIVGAALIIYISMYAMLAETLSSVNLPAIGAAIILEEFLRTITIRVGIFFLLIAIFDLAFQKKNFAKEMMMEKFEVKQEFKDTEGDPQIKGKRRQTAREIAYSDGPSATKGARAIVTNPEHIAVALGYNEETDPAPRILVMGRGFVARAIMKIATEEKIPVMRNPELARQLYCEGEISDYVPENTYGAIAEILKWLSSLEEKPDVNMELFQ
ncbi:MAG: type III secretion system export apparatus subunit SctU [Chlamydiota bacterium]